MAQSVSAWPLCKKSQVRSPDLMSLFQQLSVLCSLSSFKDGAYYCYCAYVLSIARYSDFLSPMLTNIGIFLRGLKLTGESRP